MSESKERLRDLLMGAVISALIVIPLMRSNGYFDPVPYSYVTLTSAEVSEHELQLRATFLKTDQCDFVDLRTYGEAFGQWSQIPWRDLDTPEGDRIEGWHTLSVAIDVTDGPYNTVEIRTRHLCEGEKQDNVFLSYTP